jgi:thioredoxin
MGNLIELNSASFDAEVTKNPGLVLIDFWAPWCAPCRMQTPILEKLSLQQDLSVTIAKINTDENPDLAQQFNISSIPTLILIKGGKEVDRFVGVQPESVLIQKINSYK